MQLTPRYEGAPALRFDPPVDDPAALLLRVHRRLLATLGGLDADQWSAPSRCAGWATRDVVSHLITVDGFWAASIGAGRAGQPTRFLVGFDPVATPAQLVEAAAPRTDPELLADLAAGTDQLAASLDGLDAGGWARVAEAPPGHLAISEVVVHALWDAWIHERDICLPLGIAVPEEPDEVAAALAYAAAVGPALLAGAGATRTGAFRVAGTAPDVDLVVEVGPAVTVRPATPADGALPTVAGTSVGLAESFSLRADRPEVADDARWMVDTLTEAFDQAG